MIDYKYSVTKDDADQGLRLKGLLDRHFSFSSRMRTKIKKNRAVYLNGAPMES